MALIHVKLSFPSQSKDMEREKTVEATDLSKVLRLIRDSYSLDYYTLLVFKNGIKVEDEDEKLVDGDDVMIVPVFSGG